MKAQVRCITLRHLIFENKKYIGLEYNADNAINVLLNSFVDLKWSEEYKLWYITNVKNNIDKIFNIFKGIAWINCKYFFKDKPINTSIPEPNMNALKEKSEQSILKRKCPREYIDKLEIKRYSLNTARAYIGLFENFINFYPDK